MNLTQLTPDITVSDQLHPADFAELAKRGYKAVICNRPDGEEAGQPTMATNKAAALAAGLVYAALPVSGMPTAAHAEPFAALVAQLPKPLVAHCKSGGRSKALVGMLG